LETPERRDWFNKIKRWKTKYPYRYDVGTMMQEGGILKPQAVIEEVTFFRELFI